MTIDNVYERFEYAGLIVEIVHDDDAAVDPLVDQDNVGTIYSWIREFGGDKQIRDPDFNNGLPYEALNVSLEEFFAEYYDGVLVVPLYFVNYGANGARLRLESDAGNANCALVFTKTDLEEFTNVEFVFSYAKDRVKELDYWMQGYVWGIRVRERTKPDLESEEDGRGEVLADIWGFIGDPDSEYIRDEAYSMAQGKAEAIAKERTEADYWAARDVMTV